MEILKIKETKRYSSGVRIPEIFILRILLFIFMAVLCLNAEEQAEKKVVYLEIDMEYGELKDDPFFSGLVIEENIEKPSLDFDFSPLNPPAGKVEMDPGIRRRIVKLKPENTFDISKFKKNKK